MRYPRFRSLFLAIGVVAMVSVAVGGPLGTDFTYQGQLKDAGVGADGEFDFKFRLYDLTSTQVGGEIEFEFVQVTDGLFTVELNFGAGVFTGDALWLEIDVRASGSGDPFATLSPRQPLTAAPYALYALGGPWEFSGSAITNTNSGFVGVNRSNPVTAAEYFGIQAPATGTNYGGMYIRTDSTTGRPFYGYNTGSESAWTYLDGSTGDWHVYNNGIRLTVQNDGNVGIGTSTPGTAKLLVVTGQPNTAVRGETSAGTGVRGYGYNGVYGTSSETDGNGAVGVSHTGANSYGVWGYSINGWAGTFSGKAQVTGNFYAGAKFFKIDHPMEPEEKFLIHACVESDEMKNVYDGVVSLNADGEAWVELPDWFESLNGNFRYQLTCIGEPALVYVRQKLSENRFQIAGGESGQEVSWQVTGVRRDAYARSNPMHAEVEKTEAQRGLYVHPRAFGLDDSMSIERDRVQAVQRDVTPSPITADPGADE